MNHSKIVILVMLLVTAGMAAGVPMVDDESDLDQFETGSDAREAAEYIQQNFETGEQEDQTVIQVIQRGDNVLAQESVISSLEFQQRIRGTESIGSTLAGENPILGIGNVLALAQIEREFGGGAGGSDDDGGSQEITLEDQIQVLSSMSEAEYEALVEEVLAEDGDRRALALMSSSYTPGSTTASAHNTIITQETGGGTVEGGQGFSEAVTNAQLELRDLAQEEDEQYTVFGAGIITDEIDRSFSDSFTIVGPLALLFVVVALTIAYRDLLDIVLGVVGILTVLLWTFGFMGWAGITFNQLLISVPVLLIGLSIDYAIHVFMRHREHRSEEADGTPAIRGSMKTALFGVGVALVWVTATAAIGFLANLISPIGPLQDFGVTSAFGITAALFVFGALIPALKVEIDGFLESRGFDRHKRAFGTGGSGFSDALSTGAKAARRAPLAVIALALLLSLGGAYGATQVDTTFQQEDFLAESPPAWMDSLPEPFAPSTYQAKDDLEFVQANFQQQGQEANLLIRGDVTSPETLQRVRQATEEAATTESAFILANGQPDVRTPLTVMQGTAAQSDEFAAAYQAADTDGDTIPDQNIEELYDQLLAANPSASDVIYRTETGEYEAVRTVIGLRGDALAATVADEMRDVAATLEADSGGGLTVVATGDPVISSDVEDALFDTVIQSLLITLVAVFGFLAVAYRLTGDTASLGVITLLPVLFSVTWILGTMWLIGMPFNALTGTIAALTIGLGIAYSIHVSSRYTLELQRQENVWDAMETTVTGTGGALLGSAATTVGGFGTLALAILPVLQQFGIITGLTIIYAFLASVLVLPSLLVVWTRYLGPSGYFPSVDEEASGPDEAAEAPAPDGGSERS
ncbi:Patched family protein [Halobacteriales archaeon QH_10_65_19]|nr:MAG: Patched family protein [Halobacteriales archaeon QH_10_65_19]